MRFFILLAGCAWIGGCCHCPSGGVGDNEFRLNPPTQPMSAVVAAINSNNQKILSLWAKLNYQVTINDRGQIHSVTSDDGILLYLRPSNFRLVGNQALVGRIFDLGTNDREFWMEVLPGTNRLWWGTYADLARIDPARLPIPIRPDLVMEVLGIATFNPDFTASPVPTMRYDNAADAYVFVFNVKAPNQWLAQKEIWYDRKTIRPRRVILYDANGRPVLRAKLSIDMKVQVPDQDPGQWPLVAGDFKLFFPDSASHMEFTFTDVRLYRRIGPQVVPNPGTFELPDVRNTQIQVIQIGGGGG